jgi:hypothetical protein
LKSMPDMAFFTSVEKSLIFVLLAITNSPPV